MPYFYLLSIPTEAPSLLFSLFPHPLPLPLMIKEEEVPCRSGTSSLSWTRGSLSHHGQARKPSYMKGTQSQATESEIALALLVRRPACRTSRTRVRRPRSPSCIRVHRCFSLCDPPGPRLDDSVGLLIHHSPTQTPPPSILSHTLKQDSLSSA